MTRRAGATAFAAVLLLAPAVFLGWRTTRELTWPPDVDLDRDIGQARTVAEGALLADPFYRGESVWYNPLVPAVVAGLSRTVGAAVNVVYARAGAFLNVLGPLAFFLFVERSFGRGAAAVATFHLVYVRDAASPPWMSPSYSPWLWSASFTTALFYAALLAYRTALRAPSSGAFARTGFLLGLAFLGHAAPALLLGAVMLAGAAGARRHAGSLRGHAVAAAVALVVASPFLWSIVGRYRLHVRNPAPLDWVGPGMAAADIGRFLLEQCSVATLIALWALAILVRRDPRRPEVLLVAAWAVGALGLFAYAVLRDVLPLPGLLPRHHFFLYWRGAESALVGFAAALLVRAAADRVSWPEGRRASLLVAAVGAAIALAWPSYRQRDVFVAGRQAALRDSLRANRQAARDWIETRTRPDDVFLAADDLALLVVGATGRKTVALDPYFANPYVDPAPRREARDAMLAALERGDEETFRARAAAYGVTHVVRKKSDGPPLDGAPGLVREFADARIRIYRVETAPSPADPLRR
jgi:hypothetical protein